MPYIDCEIFIPPLSLQGMKNLILFVFLCCSTMGFAQNKFASLSDDATINLITIGPGAVLNDAFGHNAIHVNDDALGLDIVFNYGKFNFKTPNFYLKFARGKLLYEVGVDKYEDFEYSYKLQQRWIKSQELQLTQDQKQDVFEFLVNNAKNILDVLRRHHRFISLDVNQKIEI